VDIAEAQRQEALVRHAANQPGGRYVIDERIMMMPVNTTRGTNGAARRTTSVMWPGASASSG
jgi:hypothetical protein